MIGRSLFLGLALVPWVAALPAQADDERAASAVLVVVSRDSGAESCPAETDLVEQIERRLGRVGLFVADRVQAEIVLELHFARAQAGRWTATFDVAGLRAGRREIEHAGVTCEALGRAAALIASMIVDPRYLAPAGEVDGSDGSPTGEPNTGATGTNPGSASGSVRSGNETGARPTQASARPSPQSRERRASAGDRSVQDEPIEVSGPRTWRIGFVAAAVASEASLPAAALGPLVRVWLAFSPDWQVVAVADYLPAQTISRAGGKLDLDRATGALLVCPAVFRTRAVALFACAGANFGYLRAWARGFDVSFSTNRVLVDAHVQALLRIRLGSGVVADVNAGLRFPTIRDTLFVDDATGARETLHRVGEVVFEGAIGLGFEL